MITLTLYYFFAPREKPMLLHVAPEQVESIAPVPTNFGKSRAPLAWASEVVTKTGQKFVVTEDADAIREMIRMYSEIPK